MCSLVFFYNNLWHSGMLLRSRSMNPQLFWFIFEGPLFAAGEDQYLCFELKEDRVLPAKAYKEEYRPLIENIQRQIEYQVLKEKRAKNK